jgi:hypothetical protein
MEAICFSETSFETQRTTRRHIPEDNTIQEIIILSQRLGLEILSVDGHVSTLRDAIIKPRRHTQLSQKYYIAIIDN